MALTTTKLLLTFHNIFKNNIDNSDLFKRAEIANPWFTERNCKITFQSWMKALDDANAQQWCTQENLSLEIKHSNKKVGLILAGNIPLVGLHDIICSLIMGYAIVVKPSTQDYVLIKWMLAEIIKALPELKDAIELSDGFVKNADAYIGTGSNNSARYFEYYFKSKPNLIRKNRTSVAIIYNTITDKEAEALGKDIFSYFGMGCRNVTHLYLPQDFQFERLINQWESYSELIHHNKYANNYTYHKAILLMNLDKHLDTGYLILVEREQIQSPVALLSYSFYDKKEVVLEKIQIEKDNIQCIVTNDISIADNAVLFGQTQEPMLWDYADSINTIDFLRNI